MYTAKLEAVSLHVVGARCRSLHIGRAAQSQIFSVCEDTQLVSFGESASGAVKTEHSPLQNTLLCRARSSAEHAPYSCSRPNRPGGPYMPCLALTAAQYKQHADCTLKSAHTPCTKFILTCSSANAKHAWPCCAKMSYCLPCFGTHKAPKLCAACAADMRREARQRLSSAHAPIKCLPFASTKPAFKTCQRF